MKWERGRVGMSVCERLGGGGGGWEGGVMCL